MATLAPRRASHLSTKLIAWGALDPAQQPVLDAMLARDVRTVEPGVPLFEQGERPGAIEILVDGCAVRDRMLPSGRRQIVGVLLAGDICDFNVFMTVAADSGCRAIGTARVARIDREALNHINHHHAPIGQAMWREAMVAASIQREWLANVAARRAEARVASAICSLFARATLAGLVDEGGAMRWPITQSDLANACGMSVEHMNRTLRTIRDRDLVRFEDGCAIVGDPAGLAELGEWDWSALHIARDAAPWGAADVDAPRPMAMVAMH